VYGQTENVKAVKRKKICSIIYSISNASAEELQIARLFVALGTIIATALVIYGCQRMRTVRIIRTRKRRQRC